MIEIEFKLNETKFDGKNYEFRQKKCRSHIFCILRKKNGAPKELVDRNLFTA